MDHHVTLQERLPPGEITCPKGILREIKWRNTTHLMTIGPILVILRNCIKLVLIFALCTFSHSHETIARLIDDLAMRRMN